MIALLLFVLPAFAGQIAYLDLSLSQLVGASDIIVVALTSEPSSTSESISVGGDQPGKCEPYMMPIHQLTVVDVLKDDVGLKGTKGTLKVRTGNAFERVEVLRQACLAGISTSPIFHRFGEKRTLPANEKFVFFLNYRKDWGFELAASWAWTDAGRAGRVLKLVEKHR